MFYAQNNPEAWLIVGFGFGLVLFYRGLRLYRESLVVADTPVTPIRSVAMGLVQIHGAAKGGNAFPSPVSGVPCYGFKVLIERFTYNSNHRGWVHYRTDQNGVRFYLEDDTGRVLVDPRSVEFDMPKNCRRQTGDVDFGFDVRSLLKQSVNDFSSRPSNEDEEDFSADARTDEQLIEYAAGAGYAGAAPFRFTEYCVKPDHEYDLVGTCVANPKPQDQNDRNLIMKGQSEQTYLISSKPANQLERSMSWRSALMVWGGAALSVGCLATLLARHHLI
jgi:hypothetical protein